MNPYDAYVKAFENKSVISLLAKSINIDTTKAIFTCSEGCIIDEEYNIISKDILIDRLYDMGEVFIKPTVDTSSGVGCNRCNIQNGKDIISGKTIKKS